MAGRGRSDADGLLALGIARGLEQAEAARLAGVSERTLRRRLDDASFMSQVRAIRGEMIAEASGRLAATMGAAATRLGELMRSQDDRIAFQAAKAILESGLKLADATELAERIERLEQALKARTTHVEGEGE